MSVRRDKDVRSFKITFKMTKSRNSCHNTTFFVYSSFSSVRKRKSRKNISTVIEKMEEAKLGPTDPPLLFMFDSHQADADAVDLHLKLASPPQTETRGIDGGDFHPSKRRSMKILEPKRTSVQTANIAIGRYALAYNLL